MQITIMVYGVSWAKGMRVDIGKHVVFLISLTVFCSISGTVWGDDANWKEIGAIWQNSYSTATPFDCHFNDLNLTDDFCEGLRDVLISKGKWSVNSGVWEGDSAEANDIDYTGSDKADSVDLFVWSGHGPSRQNYWPDGGVLHFRTNHSQNTASDYCNADCDSGNVEHQECRWGEGDCEFVFLFTCNFLNYFDDPALYLRIKDMCQGVHVICGFSCIMEVKYAQGKTLGELMMGQKGWKNDKKKEPLTVVESWFESCDRHQDEGKACVAVYHTSCTNDYLPGNLAWASGFGMSSDPPGASSSNYYQYLYDYRLAHRD